VKKFLLFLALISMAACSDGELQIETIDFDDVALDFCGTATTDTELLFKLKDSETLILDLQSGLLQNEVSGDTLESPIPAQSQLVYRILSEEVNDAYFCDAIPPVVPSVVEEIPAEAGTVYVFTTQDPNDSTLFEHRIWFKDVSFVNEAGERLTNLTVDEFGTLQTSN
jgi:hypothetical protein